FVVFEWPESGIIPALDELERRWPGVRAFSLPSMGGQGRPRIDLGGTGEPGAAAMALAYLRDEVLRLGGELNPRQIGGCTQASESRQTKRRCSVYIPTYGKVGRLQPYGFPAHEPF